MTPILAILDTGFNPNIVYRTSKWEEWLTLGKNWVDRGHPPFDLDGHGTGILSIVAASRSDIKGVNPECRVLIQKVDGAGAVRLQQNWANAILDTLDLFQQQASVGVILLASGSWGLSRELESAIELAHKLGVIIVSIAHNDNVQKSRFPGRLASLFPNVICVGAVDRLGRRLIDAKTGRGSNWGPEVTIYALGENIPALNIYGQISPVSGTSAAAAYVAGAIGNLLSYTADRTPTAVRSVILGSARLGQVLPDGTTLRIINLAVSVKNEGITPDK